MSLEMIMPVKTSFQDTVGPVGQWLKLSGMTWTPERKVWKDPFEVLSEHVAHLDSLLNFDLLAV